jgi:hypothetical protein
MFHERGVHQVEYMVTRRDVVYVGLWWRCVDTSCVATSPWSTYYVQDHLGLEMRTPRV